MRKKGLSEAMVRAVMSLYDGAKTRMRVGFAYSKNLKLVLVHIKDLCCRHCCLQ